jgi:arabinose-5-phosphate isomerase
MTSKNVPTQTMAQVLRLEADSLNQAAILLEKNGEDSVLKLTKLFEELIASGSSIYFCGVGKSGIIALKLASTFCSLGMPAHFLHPVEALHGDLGRVREGDVIVFLSKSGTTDEILKLIPFLPMKKDKMIGLLGNLNSPIGTQCNILFDCSVEKEACINNQAPTTSSTLSMAMGDAMAVLFEMQIGLSKENFAINHPGGILGKSLRMKVADIMIKASVCAVVNTEQTLQEVVLLMTKYPVGACAVTSNNQFKGIVVEGDIRRTFTKENEGLKTQVIKMYNANPIVIGPDELAYKALEKMENGSKLIHVLPVINGDEFLGFIRLHDLLKEGFSLTR